MTKLKKNMDYMVAEIDGKLYLSNGSRIFQINKTSAEILKNIDGKRSKEDITDMIANKYSLSKEKAEQDIMSIINKFSDLGVVKLVRK